MSVTLEEEEEVVVSNENNAGVEEVVEEDNSNSISLKKAEIAPDPDLAEKNPTIDDDHDDGTTEETEAASNITTTANLIEDNEELEIENNRMENECEEEAIDTNVLANVEEDERQDSQGDPMDVGEQPDEENTGESGEGEKNDNEINDVITAETEREEDLILPSEIDNDDTTVSNQTKADSITDEIEQPDQAEVSDTDKNIIVNGNKDSESEDDDAVIEIDPNEEKESQKPDEISTKKKSNAQIPQIIMDLDLECEDEPLDMCQQIKAKSVRVNFENLLKDAAKIKNQTRILSSKRPGGQLLGIGTKSVGSLVRPVMPSGMLSQTLRLPQQTQIRQGQQSTTYTLSQRIPGRNTYTSGQTVHHVPIANPTTTNQLIRTSTGNVSMQQIPSLLFDAQSGLLLMPTSTNSFTSTTSLGGLRLPISQVNTNTLANNSINPIYTSGLPVGVRPRLVYSPQQTAIRKPMTTVNCLTRPQVTSTFNIPRTAPPPQINLGRSATVASKGVLMQQNLQVKQAGQMNQLSRAGAQIKHTLGQGTVNSVIQKPVVTANPARTQPAVPEKKSDSVPSGSGDDNSKTFPSLVVTVKPCLYDKLTKQDLQKARADLDARVKALLVHSPSKFTEWLMQRGLLRLEHKCNIHLTPDKGPVNYKLGMYSDGNKQPFSGGYVWISDCCQDKQISVFQGSIFEASVYPPGTLFKLIYHWSCQTSATNVLQWVKVTSYYLKNFYTLLRSACVAALHELCPEMGGPKKYVEVGIITLGTTMTNPQAQTGAKQVKIEILGVFDPSTKAIRLKVVNPQSPPPTSTSSPADNRVLQILWPLRHWVDKQSIILIDMGIEKTLILEMGFQNVIQCRSGLNAKAGQPTNVNVMNYLKHVVPKLFQNTLCVLSKSLIQQFLDELCWRELWGHTSAATFDNMITHLVQMTKWDTGEPLITRLNKISLNPFGEWSYSRHRATGIEMLPDSIRGLSDMPALSMQLLSNQIVRNPGSKPPTLQAHPPVINGLSVGGAQLNKRKPSDSAQLMKEQQDEFDRILRTQPRTLLVESYYYAESTPEHIPPPSGIFPANLKCPLCSKQFLHNHEVVRHIFMHVQSLGIRSSQRDLMCEYCLKEVGITGSLNSHVNDVHKMIGVPYPCLICQEKFTNEKNLVLHMWENHCKQDMPYRCELCDYRNSFHYEVIEHFMKEHNGFDSVLCPHCLKVLSAKSFVCLKQIVVHMQSHTIRKGRKCPHCLLLFSTDLDFKAHLTEGAHQEVEYDDPGRTVTAFQDVNDNIKMPKPPEHILTKSLPPPTKRPKSDAAKVQKSLNVYKPALRVGDGGATQIEDFRTKLLFPLDLPTCLECGKKMETQNHFPAFLSCAKCRFSTACRATMNVHLADAHPATGEPKVVPSLKLKKLSKNIPSSIKCTCGFETKSPIRMARHLFHCDKNTAYTETPFPNESSEAAKTGEPRSFLGQLGLTRKDD